MAQSHNPPRLARCPNCERAVQLVRVGACFGIRCTGKCQYTLATGERTEQAAAEAWNQVALPQPMSGDILPVAKAPHPRSRRK